MSLLFVLSILVIVVLTVSLPIVRSYDGHARTRVELPFLVFESEVDGRSDFSKEVVLVEH